MNCSEVQERLDAVVAGELTDQETVAITRHLDSCDTCRGELEALRSLVTRAAALPAAIEPPHDLWPAITARLQPTPVRSRLGWLQLAAAVLTLAVLSIPLSVWWVGQQSHGLQGSESASTESGSLAVEAVLARSEDGVLLTRTDLEAAIERHRDVVTDDTLEVFEENMQLLDRAIGELRTALEEDPQNLRLRMQLAARYQQERKLLQIVSRV